MLLRVTLLANLVSPAMLAQSNTFNVRTSNRSIGNDTYTLASSKQRYKLNSHLTTHFGAADSSMRAAADRKGFRRQAGP